MEHMTEAHTLSIRMDDVDCEWTWYTENNSKVTFAREKVVSNNFSGAGAFMCVTRERYGLSQVDCTTMCSEGRLHDVVNISVCENNSKWSDPVTLILHHAVSFKKLVQLHLEACTELLFLNESLREG